MSSPLTLAHVLKTYHLCPTEPPQDDNISDSGSDEEVEFAKTEGNGDRRKTLLDSVQAGDSSLDQLKKQSKLEDYVGFFYLPDSLDEDEPGSSKVPTIGEEVIDLSLSTDEEGDDDNSGDVVVTTNSGPSWGCDVQRTVTSTSVTGKPDRPSDGKWACPICTLYARSSSLHRSYPYPSIPYRRGSADH